MGPTPAVARTRLAVRSMLGEANSVLVACSGGPDSVALAAAVAFEAPRAGVRADLVTVDHGLQPGSGEQAQRVVELGRSLGFDEALVVGVRVGRAGGPEGAARTARYTALAELVEPASARWPQARVALGHTRDDQAETVLLGLGRGSGPRSIAGMAPADGPWLRPFLGLDRATTVAACEAQGLPIWDDPHNGEPRFVRVRLRHEVLPLLEDVLAGGVAQALARTAELQRDDLEALEAWADAAYAGALEPDGTVEPVGTALPLNPLADLPRAVRTRVLRRWAADAGAGPLSAERTAALDALLTHWHGQGPVQLPGGVEVRRASERLVSSARSAAPGVCR